MNEAGWQTRKQRIDTRLRAIQPAWKIARYREGLDLSALDCHAVEELPTANGPADYGLFVAGKLLGIIEAKKVTVNPQNVLEQANTVFGGCVPRTGEFARLQSPVPLRHKWRNHLASRCPARKSRIPPDQRLPHSSGARSPVHLRPQTVLRLAARHAA